jgi:hypothetical protein
MVEKPNFQPFWQSPPFKKPVERSSHFFEIFKLSYFYKMWQKIEIFKNTLFEIMSFLKIDFSAQFFGKTALKTIQDGIRFEISFQKSIDLKTLLQKSLFSQCCRFQVRLKKWKCKISQFSKFKICEKHNIFRILSKFEFLF